MPLDSYGVLAGRPINRRFGTGPNPHYQVHIVDDQADYRLAINVKSKLSWSQYARVPDAVSSRVPLHCPHLAFASSSPTTR
jgi:uncharacterized protein YukJ